MNWEDKEVWIGKINLTPIFIQENNISYNFRVLEL